MYSYTTGNWTVSDDYLDTVTELGGVVIPVLDFAKDYAKVTNDTTEATIKNTTGASISSSEKFRFGSTAVKNVYAGTSVDASSQLPSKAGVQTLVELSETYRAVNSVSGGEYEIPCTARLVMRIPTSQPVKNAIIVDLIVRLISSLYSSTSPSRDYANMDVLFNLVKGALLPEGV